MPQSYLIYLYIHYINININIYIYIYTYIHIYIYICNHENNVPSQLSPQWFVATHALGHMMYGYTLLVPMNQRALKKLSKEHNIGGLK